MRGGDAARLVRGGVMERTARRVFGGAHPLTSAIEGDMRSARAALRAREAGESVVFVRV